MHFPRCQSLSLSFSLFSDLNRRVKTSREALGFEEWSRSLFKTTVLELGRLPECLLPGGVLKSPEITQTPSTFIRMTRRCWLVILEGGLNKSQRIGLLVLRALVRFLPRLFPKSCPVHLQPLSKEWLHLTTWKLNSSDEHLCTTHTHTTANLERREVKIPN